MKTIQIFIYMFIILISMVITSCSSENSNTSDYSNNNKITGIWEIINSEGYCTITFNKDGSYDFNDEGYIESGEYQLKDNKLIILGEELLEGLIGIVEIEVSNDNMVIIIENGEDLILTKISNNENTEVPFYIGKWRYQFYEDGYVLYTFNTNGTGSYYEWDNGSIDGNEKFTYLWDEKKNRISFISENGESIVVEYERISNKSIIVYDFGDSEEIWIKE